MFVPPPELMEAICPLTAPFEESRVIGTAIHDGHDVPPDAVRLLAVEDRHRLREEDPYTADIIAGLPSQIIVHRSRFFGDINRPTDGCLYLLPEQAWGLKVWKSEPPDRIKKTALRFHASYFAMLQATLNVLQQRFGTFVVFLVPDGTRDPRLTARRSLHRLAAMSRNQTSSLALAVLALSALVAAVSDEPPPRYDASALLPSSVVKGPHYVVNDAVETEGYFHVFALTSDFGPFTAVGHTVLTQRVDEIRAIAALHEVSKSEVFLKSAGGAVVDLGKGVAGVVTRPTETAKGVAGGIKRFGVNLGRASKRAVSREGGVRSARSPRG